MSCLIDNFSINVNAYDIITGYRADDSYFDYAESFLNNAISVEQLARAMRLGKLGEQIVIKSQFAFSQLKFEGFDIAEKEEVNLCTCNSTFGEVCYLYKDFSTMKPMQL